MSDLNSQRIPFIAGNWKMYKTCSEAVETIKKLAELISDIQHVEVMIAPPFTALAQCSEVTGKNIFLGAQNIFWEKEGAYTGEISPDMLISCGCKYVIIGHSERRQFFGETDETVNKKIKTAILHGLHPVFCIGETEDERKAKKTFSVLDKQVINGLKNFSEKELENLIVAYEPAWAIGTGKTPSTDQVQEVHAYLRSIIDNNFGNSLAKKIRILYGGSVKSDNIKNLMLLQDVDGSLVGGASLDAETFSNIIKF